MGQLPLHARQHRVGRQAGDLRRLAEDDAGHVNDDWVLGHLLEDLAFADEGPDQAFVVVVKLVLHLVGVLFLKPRQTNDGLLEFLRLRKKF